MNKAQLVDELAARYDGNRKAAQQALESVLDVIMRSVVKGEKVVITGFGAFEKVERAARYARNPRTGDRVRMKKTSVPKFRPGTELKAVVSGAKKLPRVAAATAKTATGRGGSSSAASKSTAARKTTTKRAATSKAAAAKTTAKKTTAKKTTAKKTTRKSAPSSAAKKTTRASSATARTAKAPAKSTTSKTATSKTATRKRATKKA